MRKAMIAAALFVGLAGSAAPALAATMMGTNGTPLDEAIKNSHGAAVDGNLITLASDPSSFLIDFISSSTLHYNGNSGGFAQLTGPGAGGGSGFVDLTILPQDVTFTQFKFNMQIPASTGSFVPPNGYQTNFTFDTEVFFTSGGSQLFNVDVGSGSGMNRFLIEAGLDEFINKIVFSNLVGTSTKNNDPTLINGYNFDSIRQMSFNGAFSPVPEPATWALFILGFGAIGAMLRRRRQVALPA